MLTTVLVNTESVNRRPDVRLLVSRDDIEAENESRVLVDAAVHRKIHLSHEFLVPIEGPFLVWPDGPETGGVLLLGTCTASGRSLGLCRLKEGLNKPAVP